ncbi:MAG: GCN5 family acetyltransferase [Thiotrichales bacterium SG8_50]|nr:MAG: GCN5 family acetyltransferase [Thiotrichales bacterium SG8_50]
MKPRLHEARPEQVAEICVLVNSAYRGETGWTRESDIVDGDRTTPAEIASIMLDPDAHLLVAVEDDELVACIAIERIEEAAYIGLFAVQPELQGAGLGKAVLAQAEKFSSEVLGAGKYVMVVVSQRPELISYYERRGYVRTGRVEDYPLHLNVGVPKVAGLTIEYLEKNA